MYRQRWSIEDGFKFTKECLGWEEVQVLDMAAIRTLVAMAWVAAGYLYEMGVNIDEPTVELLARLGGWDGRKAHKPGKIVLTRGLQRVLDLLATEAILGQHMAEYGELPPLIAAMLGQRKELCRDVSGKPLHLQVVSAIIALQTIPRSLQLLVTRLPPGIEVSTMMIADSQVGFVTTPDDAPT
jgi:hypothetical protein